MASGEYGENESRYKGRLWTKGICFLNVFSEGTRYLVLSSEVFSWVA